EITGKKDKINVLFMGSSRILFGVVPEEFDRAADGRTNSYNLGMPALPISSSYFILKDYLRNNPPPQYILMELYINRIKDTYTFNYYSSQGMTDPSEVISLVQNLQDKSILLNYLVPFRMYKFLVPKYLYNSIFHPVRIRKLKRRNIRITKRMVKNRGYYFIPEGAVEEGLTLSNEDTPVAAVKKSTGKPPHYNPFVDPFVEKFFRLTAEKNIRVQLIHPPYFEGKFSQYEEMPQHFKAVMDCYSNVSTAPGGWKLKFYGDRHFYDRKGHLHKGGAVEYTRDICNDFLNSLD
ncbi:MAG: DUF1574 domain-containing protein, partial [bacterium]|nr:DUF1574 domain-containing protein [bacterium]